MHRLIKYLIPLLLLFLSSCDTKLNTWEEAAGFCETYKSNRIAYDDMMHRLSKLQTDREHDGNEIIIRVFDQWYTIPTDSCWVTIWYDTQTQKITGCGVATCQ